MQLIYQRRCGLFPEHVGIAGIVREARITPRAIEALLAAGVEVEPLAASADTYRVTIRAQGQMPRGLVASWLRGAPWLGVRIDDELSWPSERQDVIRQADWTPCPECGAAVIWYEAGYTPGYRVCIRPPHHHLRIVRAERRSR